MPIYFGSQLINEARVGTQLYDAYVGSQMVHGKERLPAFTYTGTYEEHPASYYGLSGDYIVVAFLGSGTLTLTQNTDADIFMLGGGGGGGSSTGAKCGGGGGGGYRANHTVTLAQGVSYALIIGEGGAPSAAGGQTKFGDIHTVNGGGAGGNYSLTAGGAPGIGGSNGGQGWGTQGLSSTKGVDGDNNIFGEVGNIKYGPGGGGGDAIIDVASNARAGGATGGGAGATTVSSAISGKENHGAGGGGGGGTGYTSGAAGGSGVILMRKKIA